MLTLARRRSQRGFTLAEILVTTAVFAIIMIAALAVYDRSNQTFKSGTEAADLQQSTRVGFDKLVSDVRMAGFDYNRGGTPTNSWQALQPDEQIEYAGPSAIVFRSNFNYNSATGSCGSGTAPCGNGLEPAYTPVNVNGQPIFPYVTTSNDEIIAYVLRSTDASKNTGSISFYADDFKPRAAFPNNLDPAPAGSNQSKAEEVVTIPGIDTTNDNPPYTLYRVTVTDVKNNSLGTPVAENIRSMKFQYYTDFAGTTLVKNPDGSDIATGRNADGTTFNATGTGAIGGDGKFDPNAAPTGNFNDRLQRAQITGVRVSLVGLNANPDLQGYTNGTETVASIKKYRQYSLSSLVVPRNLGLTGFPEPNYNPPSPPTIKSLCSGHCAVTVIYWDPPSTGNASQYLVEWDTSPNGSFSQNFPISDPTQRSAVLPDTGDDPSVQHWYRMKAVNDNGPSPPSSPPWAATPKNRTQPQAPSAVSGVSGLANKITLNWTAPATNAAGKSILSCTGSGGSSDGSAIPQAEMLLFRVQRSVDSGFSTDPGVNILDPLGGGNQPNPAPMPGQNVTWDDSGANSAYYPANCTPYYYRVLAADRCCKNNAYNQTGNASDSISAASLIAGPFQATSSTAPAVPGQPSIDYLNTKCPDPLNPAQCTIKITWPASLSDIASNKIGIDQYAITRAFRVSGSGAAFNNDPTFGTLGTRTVNCDTGTCTVGYSQLANTVPRTFTDTPPLKNGVGALLDYRYTVAAKNCGLYSGNSPYGVTEAAQNAQTTPSGPNPYVDYPGCPTNAAITTSSSYGGTQGSGDSPTSPYVFLAGDSVSIKPNPPAGTTVNSVDFSLYTYPTPVQVGTTTTINAPGSSGVYTYPWGQQTPGSTYMLVMTVNTTYQGGPCKDVKIKYVQQEAAVGCFFDQATTSPSVSQGSSGTATGIFNYTGSGVRATNNSSIGTPLGDIKLATSSPSFTGNMAITWSDTTAQHPEMILASVEWHVISATGTDTIVSTTTVNSPAAYNKNGTGIGTSALTTTVNFPTSGGSGWPAIPPGSSLGFRINFTYDATKGNKNLSANQISKICITYRTLLEPLTDKHCNLVGSGNSNPTSCN